MTFYVSLLWILVLLLLLSLLCTENRLNAEYFSGGEYTLHQYPDVLRADECKQLIESSEGKGSRSTVMGENGTSDVRTSTTTWMTKDNAGDAWPIVEKIRHFAAKVTGIDDFTRYEDLQLVKYLPGQLYKSHFDSAVELSDSDDKLHRVATFIVYLNDDFTGGETAFPKLDQKITPRQGHGALFYNLNPEGTEEAMSLHESIPVRTGVKYAVQLWIRK